MKSESTPRITHCAATAAWLIMVALLALGCSANDPPESGEARGGGQEEAGVSTAMFADTCCSSGDLLACQDGRWCTGEEGCDCWGNCEVGAPINCNDGDPCTNDYCVDDRIDPPGTGYGDGHCEHVCIPGPTCECPECFWPSDCDDADECTVDTCDDFGQCVYVDLNCNDGNVCTDDTCDSLLGCINTPIPGCCNTNADCNDGVLCTTDVCNTATHECVNNLVAGYCLIGGVCYTNGTVNPANPCESCQYLQQNDRWSGLPAGTTCDDGRFCTSDSTCDGDGNCVGAGNPCNDGMVCTDDVCNETTDSCSYPVRDTYCYIGGVCRVDYEINPANECQRCLSTSSKTAWSPVPAGTACDDELYCTAVDQCNGAGSCVGVGNPCDDFIECTDNVCNEASDDCSYPVSANRCYIDTECYTHHDLNLDNDCQWCDSTLLVNRTVWTNRPEFANCDNGLFCDGTETCDGAGNCLDRVDPCIDAFTCTTDTCDDDSDTCSYPIDPNWCLISNVCYAEGVDNPANQCQLCESATIDTAWTNKPSATPCDDEVFCTAVDECNGLGSCMGSGDPCDDGVPCTDNICNEAGASCSNPPSLNQCYIDGACYTNGEVNLANICQWCDPSVSQTAWTNRPSGAACSNGDFCDGAETCDGAGNCQDNADPCPDGLDCTDDICDEGLDSCSNPIIAGYCLIGGVCYDNLTISPFNNCQYCLSGTSQTAWTNRPNGDSCDDGLFCTGVDTCNGSGTCLHPGNPCDDGLACTDNVCAEPSSCTYPVIAGNCLIGGTCYTNGTVNSSNHCQGCVSATNQTDWTDLPSGTDCDDGDYCNGTATCDGAGTCVPVVTNCDDSLVCTTDGCDEVADACTHSIDPGTCLISGSCYVDTELNSANDCQECDSTASQTSWTNLAPGTACDDGLFCTVVDTCDLSAACMGSGNPCVDGIECTDDLCTELSHCSNPISLGHCYIDLECYHNTDLNSENPCQSCDRPVSRTSWTNLPSGTACSNGDFCDGAETCDGAGNCLDNADPCVDGIDCTDDNCDEGTNTCDNPVTSGWCYISSACIADGTDRSGNVCQWCDDSMSQIDWTNKVDGQYIGCDATVDQCNYNSCVSGTCQVLADTGAACTYLVDECHDPGVCLADGTCGPGAHVYPPNNTCAGVIEIPLDGSGNGSVSGSTLCADNTYAGTCDGDLAQDVVYFFTLPVTSDYQLYAYNVVYRGAYDSVMYLRNNCTDASDVYCNDDCISSLFLDCSAYDWYNSAIHIRAKRADQARTFYLVADGEDATTHGDFTIDITRVAVDNNPCATVADNDRLVRATAGGVFRGNITGYVNDLQCMAGVYLGSRCDCDHPHQATGCESLTSQFGGFANFPPRAWFELAPSAATTYCIWTNEADPPNAFDTFIDVFDFTSWSGCGSYISTGKDVTCTSKSGIDPISDRTKIQVTVPGSSRYLVGIGPRCCANYSTTGCTATDGTDYEVHFDVGACP